MTEEKTPKQQREDDLIKRLTAGIHELAGQEGVDWHSFCHQAIHQVVMPQVEPLLNALDEVATAADRLNRSHAHLVQDSPDPGSEAMGAEWEMTRILRKLQYFEPHDWTYISRFSAMPQEIHKVLKDGLCEDTYLNYQRFIGEKALEDVLKDQHASVEGEPGEPGCWHDGAHSVIKTLDPARDGYRFPVDLIDPA